MPLFCSGPPVVSCLTVTEQPLHNLAPLLLSLFSHHSPLSLQWPPPCSSNVQHGFAPGHLLASPSAWKALHWGVCVACLLPSFLFLSGQLLNETFIGHLSKMFTPFPALHILLPKYTFRCTFCVFYLFLISVCLLQGIARSTWEGIFICSVHCSAWNSIWHSWVP